MFLTDGFHGVTVYDLGTAAGISGPAIYRHFSSKQAILADLLHTAAAAFAEASRGDSAPRDKPHPNGLNDLAHRWIGLVAERPESFLLLSRELGSLQDADRQTVSALVESGYRAAAHRITQARPQMSAAASRALASMAFTLIVVAALPEHSARIDADAFAGAVERMLAGSDLEAAATG